jgi:integrase
LALSTFLKQVQQDNLDVAPEPVGIASELLGHASIKTTEQHYILARGMTADRPVKASISAARA